VAATVVAVITSESAEVLVASMLAAGGASPLLQPVPNAAVTAKNAPEIAQKIGSNCRRFTWANLPVQPILLQVTQGRRVSRLKSVKQIAAAARIIGRSPISCNIVSKNLDARQWNCIAADARAENG
jgi:hypothetical protein